MKHVTHEQLKASQFSPKWEHKNIHEVFIHSKHLVNKGVFSLTDRIYDKNRIDYL